MQNRERATICELLLITFAYNSIRTVCNHILTAEKKAGAYQAAPAFPWYFYCGQFHSPVYGRLTN